MMVFFEFVFFIFSLYISWSQPPPKDPPWFTDDKCHMSVCAGALVLTKSMCFMKGASCPEVSLTYFFREHFTLSSWIYGSLKSRCLNISQVVFFSVFMDFTESKPINTLKKRGQTSAILNEQTWSKKDLRYRKRKNLPGHSAAYTKLSRYAILPTRVANHNTASFPLTKVAI